jgi:eukaryotic-like serine/threonine-protein kinase
MDRRPSNDRRSAFGSRVATQDEFYGEYRVLEELGHGAMGMVYRAHDPRLGRDVALKLVLPARIEQGASKARARLVAEARALARVSHPNVLAIYDVGVRDDIVFIALELVDGIDLAQWLRARKRSWPEVVRIFVEVAAGLAAVHDADLVHRDVKPANILVERAVPGRASERVLVADFGIARATSAVESITLPGDVGASGSDVDTPLTDAGRVVGTPAYMAPEQHLGREVGPAADQYSLCVALHEALYGTRPFHGHGQAIAKAKLAPPERAPSSEVPTWLWRIVRRGLSPRLHDRYASIRDLRAALVAGPRYRRWIAPAAAVTTLVAGTAIAWATIGTPRCEQTTAKLGEVWNEGRRASIAATFAASERPLAEQDWARVSARLDGYGQEIVAAYRDACEATHVRHEQTEALLDRRMACLDQRMHGFEQSLALLATGDADIVDHADDVASSLRSIEACSDIVALETGIEPPSPAQRDAVTRVDRVVADAEALSAAGRFAEGAEAADAAVELARVVDYRPALVEALTVAAELHERRSEIDEARAALDEAISTGMEIGADSMVLRAVVLRVWIAAEYERDLATAEKWGAVGRSLLKRVGDPRQPGLGLHNSLGNAYAAAGRHAEALREFEDALAMIEDDPELAAWAATLHSNIGGVRFRLGELERATESYTRARDLFRALHGENHPNVADSSVRLAQTHAQRGRHQEAIAGLRAAIASLESMQAAPAELANALISLGTALRNSGADDESSTTYRRAVELLEGTGNHVTLAHALLGYGSSCVDKGIYDAAETQLQRAVALLEPIDPASPDVGNAWIGLGRIREHQSKPAEALSFYRRAYEAAPPDTRIAARALVAIAQVHRAAGRYDDAIAELDRQDAILAAAPTVILDDRLSAAIARVEVLIDTGRVTDSAAPIDALDRLLAQARDVGGSRRSGEGELALGRARWARGERDAARAALARAVLRLDAGGNAELARRARAAAAELESSSSR